MRNPAIAAHAAQTSYSSKRAESGNAISNENPSFDAGATGGCGDVRLA
jgi:hypothetical protein